MRLGKKHFKLQTTITMLVCIVVIVALVVTGILIGEVEARQTKKDLSEKVMNMARVVGHSPIVINGLQEKNKSSQIAEYAAKMRRLANVRFIVVMDMNGIRLSHPDKWKIGKHFVGGDEKRALHGQEYVSVAVGTLGKSLRAFEPIYDKNGKQIGAVAVGILMNHVRQVVLQSLIVIYFGLGVGLAVGMLGALFLARKIKKILFGLEPPEIANLLQERNAMMESVREGILAVNNKGEILVANASAISLFERAGMQGDPIGKKVDEYLPFSHLPHVVETGVAEYDQERHLNGVTWVANRVPIIIEGKVVGAIATFRDKTELKQLAEQLTGVKMYAEALRVKTHEFINKLHVIVGMVHIGAFERLASYVRQLTEQYQMEVGTVSRLVKDPVLAGFLLSKISYSREQLVNLRISGEYVLPQSDDPEIIDDLITILGNLIDNAVEAVQESESKNIDVFIEHENDWLMIFVKDTGHGIPQSLTEKVFQKGFSTKGKNRGYGLFLLKQSIERLGGKLSFSTNAEGTMFKVELPYRRKGEKK
ncbi:MAG TPA: DcuS/MalK family sensor histidine kinase [Bacillales bacterium]|nr:DcuS/MalK family sensor histidine kinase [Bacillales bacterium]